ncbi:hypothetical protein OFN25_25900, partial [Escherichia coli]|nr:hypothetical protein [Escherichia coli]
MLENHASSAPSFIASGLTHRTPLQKFPYFMRQPDFIPSLFHIIHQQHTQRRYRTFERYGHGFAHAISLIAVYCWFGV